MILDFTKLPANITLKNVDEEMKIRLVKLVDSFIEKDDTIILTVTSSEEAAVVNRRIQELGLNPDNGGQSDLPDKIFTGQNITISFKDYIDSKICTPYMQCILEVLHLETAMQEFIAEHEAAGDIDDPEVQAELARMQEEGERLADYVMSTYGHYISDSAQAISLFGVNADLLVPIFYRTGMNKDYVYLYPDMESYMIELLGYLAPGYDVDYSAVTKPGWYLFNVDGTVISFSATATPKNVELSDIMLSNNLEEVSYLDKSVYKDFFESIIINDTPENYVLTITGLSEYSSEYNIGIVDDGSKVYNLGHPSEIEHYIPTSYSGDIYITLYIDNGEVEEKYTTTISTDSFEDYNYQIDLSGHSN